MKHMNQAGTFVHRLRVHHCSWRPSHMSTLSTSRSRITSANLGGQRGTTNVTFSSVLASINLLRWMSGLYWNHTYRVNQWDWTAVRPAKWIRELLFGSSLSYQMKAALFVSKRIIKMNSDHIVHWLPSSEEASSVTFPFFHSTFFKTWFFGNDFQFEAGWNASTDIIPPSWLTSVSHRLT